MANDTYQEQNSRLQLQLPGGKVGNPGILSTLVSLLIYTIIIHSDVSIYFV